MAESRGRESLPLRWRLLRDPPAGAARNMAVDEALARCRAEGVGVLRIYRWARPSVSFGRNQSARRIYDPDAFGPLGADVVRRPTGGREVLHDRELTYSLVLPLRTPGGLREVYRLVNAALVEALASLGIGGATLAVPQGRTPSPDAGACFRQPAAGEVVVAGRKVAGSAQVRMGDTLLQHGSLLLAPSTLSLAALVRDALPAELAPEQEGITVEELSGGPVSFPRVAAAVAAALAGSLGGRWARDGLTSEESDRGRELEERYRSPEWIWRR
ncbi:MAG: lipoate--protein ligase family protein [Gemmatimonadales bacterium]|nr:MAG: lipoate--protein ligase family protein [Gemmatimonadales bacterium]